MEVCEEEIIIVFAQEIEEHEGCHRRIS
jgi:hypothetical protein